MLKNENADGKEIGNAQLTDGRVGWRELSFDPAKYKQYVEEFEISEEQKNELLLTLFNIMKAFVDIGFGVDSVQKVFPPLVELLGPIHTNDCHHDATPKERDL